MAGFTVENVNTREQIASRAHEWLRALTVDPLVLREKHGMKGKKHLVELLLGYQGLYTFFESTGNHNSRGKVLADARTALAVVAEAGLDIYEHAPRRVKQAVVGYGAAQKMAVAKMVQRMLRLSELPAADAADALAVALTHAQESTRFSLSPAKKV